ncbi:MAG TPA: HdeA/HdeB family chaperone [Albidovulum sp.]|uniref:HdeA/HdeB family chaperone n=1 Tax=Albidovulum sp. TaxID=1872424 RepID=UPI002CBFBD58|nr:HdeA/HdeB family chaperone [Albidovulum sp.]
MKIMLAALSLVAAAALPALSFAEEKDPAKITCAEFEAMDSAGMMQAVEAIHKAGPDGAMAMDAAKTEEAVKMTTERCTGKPDMMAMEAMTMK